MLLRHIFIVLAEILLDKVRFVLLLHHNISKVL